ncbi:Legume-like lectin family protein [Trichomonas vaginalis G3]|uniref:Legume-like lectin family protein n=2 Tax=Trichomonas vaginalis TaxID=5722 RepID=A2EDR1_TRIV3|nr:carbohydrate binding [Trichomonas vaginalis G3]EAY09226.1 Legume-like lectin family protein [Trichomonas vaginalis G3]KAI5486807.1 carbohydrate binding [Trichomonas vaginalis G3]|eukprot:XP_001321449.1 Legume-like lectin family protein [Trichomonas vaginalis G3]
MFQLLLSFSAAKTVADVAPPYQLDKNGKIGLWEYSGATVPTDEGIIVVPPLQHRKGCLWTDVEIPSDTMWLINYTLQIPRVEGGQFGFWFISKYGAQGNLAGGPQKFDGIAILAQVAQKEDGKFGFYLNYFENDGTKAINPEDISKNGVFVDFSRRAPFQISIQFLKNKIGVYSPMHTINKGIILEAFLKRDISQNYIGMTAQTDYYTMRLDLLDIKFDVNLKTAARHSATMKTSPHSAKYQPSVSRHLRNSNYNLTLKEADEFEKNQGIVNDEKNIYQLLDVIEEINKANFDVASFSELNAFIRNNILNYTQKWQKRTVKLVERVQNTRDIASSAFNYTHQMMELFRDTMSVSVSKANSKIHDMNALLNEIGARGVDENRELQEMANEVNKHSIGSYLMYAAIAEVVGILILLISAMTCGKNYVYGSLRN